MALEHPSLEVINHLKQLYSAYRHTSDISSKGGFFSSTCLQICRPRTAFAATDRETIVQYLREASDHGPSTPPSTTEAMNKQPKKSYYTIRPLREDEFEFGTDDHVKPAGFASADDLKQKAKTEGWIGMRVDLWDEESEDGSEGILVKVQYWWRKQEQGWIQICHDIMYLGPRDGTEGSQGELLE
ncbi:hypothetical protein ACQKWADRAFT_305663 [Trichoderma austrokoningii]